MEKKEKCTHRFRFPFRGSKRVPEGLPESTKEECLEEPLVLESSGGIVPFGGLSGGEEKMGAA